jgi:hypothetical protein
MTFETKQDVLNWYEGQERTLTPEFIEGLPWNTVKDTPLDPKFIPVLLYMRDVEVLTDMYHRELQRTPTGRDPVIAKFMERWGVEEVTHGQIINRFLNEAGYDTPDDWQKRTNTNVPAIYHANTYMLTLITNLLGSRFTATHMAFGAIHEMSTAQAYRRMIEIADHPVLTRILEGIIREESAHTHFYWSVAKLELQKSKMAQKVARKVIDTFYVPVGQGSLAKSRAEYSVAMLFGGEGGIEQLDRTVTKRAQQLPGFDGLTKVTKRIGDICRKFTPQRVVSAAALMLSVNLYSVV